MCVCVYVCVCSRNLKTRRPRPNLGNCVTEKQMFGKYYERIMCRNYSADNKKNTFQTKRCPWQNREAGIRLSNTTTPEDEEEEEDGMDGGHPQRLKF